MFKFLLLSIAFISVSCSKKIDLSTKLQEKKLQYPKVEIDFKPVTEINIQNNVYTFTWPGSREHFKKLKESGLVDQCPHGHTDLVDVKVSAGFAIDNEQKLRVNNFKVWFGGCTVSDGEKVLRCKECLYYFDPGIQVWQKAHVYKLKSEPVILPVLDER